MASFPYMKRLDILTIHFYAFVKDTKSITTCCLVYYLFCIIVIIQQTIVNWGSNRSMNETRYVIGVDENTTTKPDISGIGPFTVK